ncbi:purine-binding chemotaxis protein CheW [Clostridium botulinum C]|uniref:Purine-binding chemotaxis protein CheW n=2 Tax=Clostridium botulinum TaxID=1491 RepID=A0A9Q4XU57_CLOBO|nr:MULTISPECIES: chemotaxis protein CheW [Clostridium]EGO87764.1 chemotaxis protein CheW [Clostridium botulinum C str. Stockholm]KEI10692.1 chemotaxis protein CheW [Clostridium sp. K25]MCD3194065.1 purine-binding chemotaxis protein CheW [Clostridium botulinum C]MCD3199306.1 purine-binding chemotaxis protein CheW [Clostridium botulinum C]MCD3204781.1 purine-binding chemotaxis protein CheW [Clostridium botulinum C]
MQVVIFKLGDEQIAVETAKVQGINDMMEITKVPNAPNHIKGLINLRGNVISLLDINLLLNISKKENQEHGNIIILKMEDEQIGITVDQVDEVLEIEEDILEKVDDSNKAYIKGIINFKTRVVTLIDIDKLFAN